MSSRIPKVVTIGGGTGSFVLLSGLKDYDLDISAIVTMMDSGGSTGRLHDQLGVLPSGDLRQALVALSQSEEIWRKLFTYRFSGGDLDGHNFGNIFISALEKITGYFPGAVDMAEKILQTNGQIIPVTLSDATLCAQYADGTTVAGEHNIEETKKTDTKITRMFLTPPAVLNLDAKRALERADFIIIGPGDLHTSILPNILVNGFVEVLKHSKAKKVYIANLMTRTGQTDGFKVSDYIGELSKYIGEDMINYVILNSRKPKKELLEWYKKFENSVQVEDDMKESKYKNIKVIKSNIVSKAKFEQNKNDRTQRSLIRHAPEKLAEVLYREVFTR